VRADRPHYAFEKMIPAEERGRVSPDLGEEFEIAYASAYGPFKNHELVRLFLRNGQDMQYERVGAKDIGPTPDGFEAVHVYRLRCPEGTYEATVRLLAADQRRGGKLQWRVPGGPPPHKAGKGERASRNRPPPAPPGPGGGPVPDPRGFGPRARPPPPRPPQT